MTGPSDSSSPHSFAPEARFPERTHGPAIASLVIGIASFFFGIFGVAGGLAGFALGLTSLRECRPTGAKRGRGVAIAGMVCSLIAFVAGALTVIHWP